MQDILALVYMAPFWHGYIASGTEAACSELAQVPLHNTALGYRVNPQLITIISTQVLGGMYRVMLAVIKGTVFLTPDAVSTGFSSSPSWAGFCAQFHSTRAVQWHCCLGLSKDSVYLSLHTATACHLHRGYGLQKGTQDSAPGYKDTFWFWAGFSLGQMFESHFYNQSLTTAKTIPMWTAFQLEFIPHNILLPTKQGVAVLLWGSEGRKQSQQPGCQCYTLSGNRSTRKRFWWVIHQPTTPPAPHGEELGSLRCELAPLQTQPSSWVCSAHHRSCSSVPVLP